MSSKVLTIREWAARPVDTGLGVRRGVALLAVVAAMTLAAYIRIPLPFTAVPITLQPMVAILAGALLGPALGASAMVSYLLLGAAGAPVFSGGAAGALWLFGPTGGYLLAWPATAWIVGTLLRRGPIGGLRLHLALAVGIAVMYLGGIAQLALMTGAGVRELLWVGVVPFIPGDVLKVALAARIVRRGRKGGFGAR